MGLTMLDAVALIVLAVFTGLLVGWHLFSLDAQRLKKPVQMLDPPKRTNTCSPLNNKYNDY